ncbi:MAG: NAD(P)H-hydrate dehydratase, partial [Candidatus Alkanophagales archaeon]
FHKPKPGLRRASAFVGTLKVAGIGIPPEIERLAGPGDLRLLRRRRADSHKGDNGRVLIVGGGPFSGAPTLAALAALRAGADWVTVATPKSVSKTVASFSPNLIVRELSSDVLVEDDVPTVLELARRHDVTVVGTGLGDDAATRAALRTLFRELEGKIVVDADGFYGLELPARDAQKLVITPHAGEFSKIPGVAEKPPADTDGRAEFVRRFSGENKVVTLMKGSTDVISDGKRVKLNVTGNAGMTVGGTGDVLAGVVGAFYAVNEPFRAAVAAAFVSGVAGDIAFEEKGYGLLATDVIENIPEVLRRFGRRP